MSRDVDSSLMSRAIELARRGQGAVEPNPMVGCVIVRDGEIVGEGWHQRFGGPHAEVEALRVAGPRSVGATMYVTLEPCCHTGKTPPCVDAVLQAGIARVVIAHRDPFPAVAGGGIVRLQAAGVAVDLGVGDTEAQSLNAPYLMRLQAGRPWILGKWAMTLDGRIATKTGDSRWISNEASRRIVHQLRGRVDAVAVGRGTVERDDPLLTARPTGPRCATRVVFDRQASLRLDSQLVRSLYAAPILIVASDTAPVERISALTDAGCEVLTVSNHSSTEFLRQAFCAMGERGWTNVLVEGGGTLLGALFDAQLIDELHVFIGPKCVGGQLAPGPLGGEGVVRIADAWSLERPAIELLDGDIYIHGRPT